MPSQQERQIRKRLVPNPTSTVAQRIYTRRAKMEAGVETDELVTAVRALVLNRKLPAAHVPGIFESHARELIEQEEITEKPTPWQRFKDWISGTNKRRRNEYRAVLMDAYNKKKIKRTNPEEEESD